MEQRFVIKLGVLGFLNEGEATLKRIQERFNHRFGRHQFAGYGPLEPLMEHLREEEYVRGSGTYAITEPGREHLQTLLRERVSDVTDPNHRPHLLVKLGFLHHLSRSDQREELAHLEDQFSQARSEWIEAANAHDGGATTHSEERLKLIDLTIQLIDTQLEWIRKHRQSM